MVYHQALSTVLLTANDTGNAAPTSTIFKGQGRNNELKRSVQKKFLVTVSKNIWFNKDFPVISAALCKVHSS
jgi:hypothetical protein